MSRSPPPSPSGLLYWYRDTEILKHGGRVNISTSLEDETVSRLLVHGASVNDSGNYTCWPTKFLPASVMVHVIPGKAGGARAGAMVGGCAEVGQEGGDTVGG